MEGYLKPWRRKIGIVTLVMACLFARGWVRSLRSDDGVAIRENKQIIHFLSSSPRGIEWQRKEELLDGVVVSPRVNSPRWYSSPWKENSASFHFFSDGTITRRWELFGFCVGQKTHDDRAEVMPANMSGDFVKISPESLTKWGLLRIPYWSIVIPLALISVWLLLSPVGQAPACLQKSRASNSH